MDDLKKVRDQKTVGAVKWLLICGCSEMTVTNNMNMRAAVSTDACGKSEACNPNPVHICIAKYVAREVRSLNARMQDKSPPVYLMV